MECGKDLALNRFVMTEIGESVRIFRKILQKRKSRSDRGGLNLISMHDMNRLENVDRMPGATSGIKQIKQKPPAIIPLR